MSIAGRKVLVTGGAGFLGSHIVEGLLASGAEVRVLDTFLSGRPVNLNDCRHQIEFLKGDINDRETVEKAMRGTAAVVHSAFPLAAYDRSLDNQFIAGGTVGLFNILRAAVQTGSLVVYTSSIAVYGKQQYLPIDENHPLEPILLYGATKLAGELYCRTMASTYGLKAVILRITDIYGPRNGRISAPIRFLLNGLHNRPIIVKGDGAQSRTYTYIADLVDAVCLALTTPNAVGETLNISGDECVSVRELAEICRELTGSRVPVQIDRSVTSDPRKYAIANQKAKSVLGFSPTVDIRTGLAKTLGWLQNNPNYFETEDSG